MNCRNHQDKPAIGSCTTCGSLICEDCGLMFNGKLTCKNCIENGTATGAQRNSNGKKDPDWMVTLLLCLFVGSFGAHRFYVGKTGTAILQLLTLGGCGFWALYDFIIIICKKFRDANGNIIE